MNTAKTLLVNVLKCLRRFAVQRLMGAGVIYFFENRRQGSHNGADAAFGAQ